MKKFRFPTLSVSELTDRREREMAVLYHVNTARRTDLEGRPYRGAWRGMLSEFFGEEVGFAYSFLPEGWEGQPWVYEILVPDDAIVMVHADGDQIPRLSTHDWSRVLLIPAWEAVNYTGEVAFPASQAQFGRSLGGP